MNTNPFLKSLLSILLYQALPAPAAESPALAEKANSPESLKAEIEALKAPKVAWREIAWRSCLIEGLRESHAKKKPVLLWIFIDRPLDDGRC